jgi:hypothetical protein
LAPEEPPKELPITARERLWNAVPLGLFFISLALLVYAGLHFERVVRPGRHGFYWSTETFLFFVHTCQDHLWAFPLVMICSAYLYLCWGVNKRRRMERFALCAWLLWASGVLFGAWAIWIEWMRFESL